MMKVSAAIDSAGPSSGPTSSAAEYLAITPSERRTANRAVKILAETPLAAYLQSPTSPAERSNLVKAIVSDLISDDSTWREQDRASALKVAKELSSLPGSSEALAASESIRNFVLLTKRESSLSPRPTSSSESASLPSPSSSSSQRSSEALDLVLRVLNNVLFQHSQTRAEFGTPSVGGVKVSLDLISTHISPVITFLSARLLFFSTLYEAEITKEAVEEMQLVDIFAKRTEALLQGKITADVDLAIAELQKAFFNVDLYYPRLANNERTDKAIVGERFHKSLLPFLAPTIRLVVSYPSRTPTSLCPPLTNAIAVLLNYPVAPYQQIWSASYYSPQPLKKGSNGSDDTSQSSWSSSTSKAKRIANSLFNKASSSSSHKASSSISSNYPSLSSIDVLNTLINLLDEFFQRYFTTLDPDDTKINSLAQRDDIDLQDYSEPALLLCRRLVDEVAEYRRAVKSRILPSDIDRSQGLNTRMDLTGILIRMMFSSVYPRLARASGEVLLALCDGEATKMTAEIGYGPCAGFLMSIGQMHSLPGAPSSNGTGQIIDPVTGMAMPAAEEMAKQDEEAGLTMTEEEKEAEAERLFSLFDRLDRTGVVKVQNPLQQGVESARIQELEDKEEEEARQRIERDDLDTETTVEREMKAFRERQKRSRD